MFTCDEETLRRHDKNYSNIGNTKDVDPDVLHGVLNFIETNTQVPDEIEVPPEVKESMDITSTDLPEIKDELTPLRQLNSVTFGIREQCKLITDLTYDLDDHLYGDEVLQKLTSVFKEMYTVCRKDSPVVPLRKDQLKFTVLGGQNRRRRRKGYFCRRRIVPLFPSKTQKSRQAKQSRFGRKTSSAVTDTTIHMMLNPEAIGDSDDDGNDSESPTPMEISDTEDNIAPFIDLASYKGQDEIKQKVLTTPGLLLREQIHLKVKIFKFPTRILKNCLHATLCLHLM